MAKIDLRLDMDTNTANEKSVSVCFYVLSNTEATFEAQFMEKLSNTEAELKKSVVYRKKEACNRMCQTCLFLWRPPPRRLKDPVG